MICMEFCYTYEEKKMCNNFKSMFLYAEYNNNSPREEGRYFHFIPLIVHEKKDISILFPIYLS